MDSSGKARSPKPDSTPATKQNLTATSPLPNGSTAAATTRSEIHATLMVATPDRVPIEVPWSIRSVKNVLRPVRRTLLTTGADTILSGSCRHEEQSKKHQWKNNNGSIHFAAASPNELNTVFPNDCLQKRSSKIGTLGASRGVGSSDTARNADRTYVVVLAHFLERNAYPPPHKPRKLWQGLTEH